MSAIAEETKIKDHRELVTLCICKRYSATQLLHAWHSRAAPILRKRIRRGHKVNAVELERTIELVLGIYEGREDAFRLDNWKKSHHLPDCPCSNKQNPVTTVKVFPLQRRDGH